MQQSTKERIPWLVMVALLILGVSFATYLTWLHVTVYTDASYVADSAICSISKRVNCETVAQNHYSIFLGVPVSVWGIVGNLMMLFGAVLGVVHPRSRPLHAYMTGLIGISVCTSILLGFISITRIHSICLFCFGIYITSGLLALTMTFVLVQQRSNPFKALISLMTWSLGRPMWSAGYVVTMCLVCGSLLLAYPRYWEASENLSGVAVGDSRGVDGDGHHWIGAREPRVEIHEYSDYECPFCRRFHYAVRRLVERYPKAVRLVHHHYPLDMACNPLLTRNFHRRACSFSKIVMCAGRQKRFWEANDYVFRNRSKGIEAAVLAQELKLDPKAFADCVDSQKVEQCLREEVKAGVKLGLRSTPTFYVDGKAMSPREVVTYVERIMKERSGTRS